MPTPEYEIAIIGGGIIGMATAMALMADQDASVAPDPRAKRPRSLIVLEAENRLAAHQTGHNSGVIHSGLYYKPGSLKARNCVEGREAMYRFCAEHGIAHERCGKVVVATEQRELEALSRLHERGTANGLDNLRRLSGEELREHEPHVRGIGGLFVPDTGIVDFEQVTNLYGELVTNASGFVQTDSTVIGVRRQSSGSMALETTQGPVQCRHLINCAGLYSDRVARMCGVEPGVRIVPFRGEYYDLAPARRHLVRNLIYPVPDPRFPFLGVHFTRRVDGSVEAGPNAVLAFKREGYLKSSFSLRDTASMFSHLGFWRMGFKHWRMAVGEFHRSFSRRAFVHALQRLLPELELADVQPGGAGVRAQALAPDGRLVDDFHIVTTERMVHVLNSPSPAATASISIGQAIARRARADFDLR